MRTTMFTFIVSCGLCLAFLGGASAAGTTSPYLIGLYVHPEGWETVNPHHCHRIVNPTTKPLDVYAVYNDDPLLHCRRHTIEANGHYDFCLDPSDISNQVVQFFAFPHKSKKFNPNAVISGFQINDWSWRGLPQFSVARMRLTAVEINPWTIGAFTTHIPAQCTWEPGTV